MATSSSFSAATGRDGIGGAAGSSRPVLAPLAGDGAEVRKGNAPVERKLRASSAVKTLAAHQARNGFGAGGICCYWRRLAGLDVNLDAVLRGTTAPSGTRLAISSLRSGRCA